MAEEEPKKAEPEGPPVPENSPSAAAEEDYAVVDKKKEEEENEKEKENENEEGVQNNKDENSVSLVPQEKAAPAIVQSMYYYIPFSFYSLNVFFSTFFMLKIFFFFCVL